MILIDFSQIVFAQISMDMALNDMPVVDENLLRHMILNKIRSLNVKFRSAYGKMYLVMDDRSYWRKKAFPQYKACRKEQRAKSTADWDQIFEIVNKIKKEMIENSPFHCLMSHSAEADDIIGYVCEKYSSKARPVLIVSTDKDFKQLQIFPGVKQFRPTTKDFIVEKNPTDYLLQHIISGDRGDGIPNALETNNNIFVDGTTSQPRMTKKRRASFVDATTITGSPAQFLIDPDHPNAAQFTRNEKLINLTQLSSNAHVGDSIRATVENVFSIGAKELPMPWHVFLMSKGCRTLAAAVADFKSE